MQQMSTIKYSGVELTAEHEVKKTSKLYIDAETKQECK